MARDRARSGRCGRSRRCSLPRRPAARIDRLDVAQRDGLVHDMQRLMRRYDGLFGHPLPFSMGWHQAPFDAGAEAHWQLHAHFLPPNLEPDRRKFMVGYELLSEPQRDITPEDAAEQLRAVPLDRGVERRAGASGRRSRGWLRARAPPTRWRPARAIARATRRRALRRRSSSAAASSAPGVLLDAASRGLRGGPRRAGGHRVGDLVAVVAAHPRRAALPRGPALPPRARGARGAGAAAAPGAASRAPRAVPVPGLRLAARPSRVLRLRAASCTTSSARRATAGAPTTSARARSHGSRRPSAAAGLRGGITYHDGVEDDARLALAVLRTAMERGAVAVTRARATEPLLRPVGARSRACASATSGSGGELDVRAERGHRRHGRLGRHRPRPRSATRPDARAEPRQPPRRPARAPAARGRDDAAHPGSRALHHPVAGRLDHRHDRRARRGRSATVRARPSDDIDEILEMVNDVLDVGLDARRRRRRLRGPAAARRACPGGDTVAREPRAQGPARAGRPRARSRAASTRRTGSWRATPSTSRWTDERSCRAARTAELPLVGAAPRPGAGPPRGRAVRRRASLPRTA